jgi:hypothetical protein
MTVSSVLVSRAVTAEQSANYLRKVITYRIDCTLDTDSPDVITGSPLIPQVDFSQYVAPFKYGLDNDNPFLVCRKHSNIRRKSSTKSWLLDAEFEYDLEKTPNRKGVIITPITRNERRKLQAAVFQGQYKLKAQQFGRDLFYNLDVAPGNFLGSVPQIDVQSMPMNSAGVPIINPPLELDYGVQIYQFEWFKRSFVDYDPYIGRSNTTDFQVTSINQGVTILIPAGGGVVVGASSTPIWLYNQLWFQNRIEIERVPTGSYDDEFELDRGLAERVYIGDDDGKGGTYDNQSIAAIPHQLRVLEEKGKSLAEPVPFDGKGKVIKDFKPEKSIYMRWRKAPPFGFSLLQIGNYN